MSQKIKPGAPLETLFSPFRHHIDKLFVTLVAKAGISCGDASIKFGDGASIRGGRQIAPSVSSDGTINLTWPALASIWAMTQGFILLGRTMFNARRKGNQKLDVGEGSSLSQGYNYLILSQRLCLGSMTHWVEWAPAPEIASDSEVASDHAFFLSVLAWILRHELAHVRLGHHRIPDIGNDSNIAIEASADKLATEWTLMSHITRAKDAPTKSADQIIEGGALCSAFGLIWVALFENAIGKVSEKHPASANRIASCLKPFNLSEDSLAAEIIGDFLKAWIDPHGEWDTPEDPRPRPTTAALDDALYRLHQKILTARLEADG